MTFEYDSQSVNFSTENARGSAAASETAPDRTIQEPDDRYPGTFFRIPGLPTPGSTAWSLTE